jgi:hypothetical protein
VNDTGDPDIFTQIVNGSDPIFSVTNPLVFVTVPGTVTGIEVPQVLPLAVTVTPVMLPEVMAYVSW